MEVKLFGLLADTLQKKSIDLEDIQDMESLRMQLKMYHPIFTSSTFVIAVNKRLENRNIRFSEKDEIALLPPFAGG